MVLCFYVVLEMGVIIICWFIDVVELVGGDIGI